MEALRGHFRPEFLNRIDEIIIFDRLSDEDLKKIVEIQLQRLARRLEKQKITLQLTDAAKALPRAGRLRSGLRRAPAEARHPEARSSTRSAWRSSRANSAKARPSASTRAMARLTFAAT